MVISTYLPIDVSNIGYVSLGRITSVSGEFRQSREKERGRSSDREKKKSTRRKDKETGTLSEIQQEIELLLWVLCLFTGFARLVRGTSSRSPGFLSQSDLTRVRVICVLSKSDRFEAHLSARPAS